MTKEEYFSACQKHDWYYPYSDDHGVWQKGEQAHTQLRNEYKRDPELRLIYDAWHDYHFSGPSFGTTKPSRPKLEAFV